MKNKAIKLFGLAFFVGLVFTTSLWARQIVTEEDREWAKEAIAREKELAASVSPNTIAVINFDNLTLMQELNPVEKGMAVMLITDLAKLSRYQTVERARMQALVDELHITGQAFADPEAETRMGKLLGAEHVVGGDILKQKLNEFKLDSDLLEVPTESITGKPQAQGKLLVELFKMEKDLPFEIIRELEIELTPEEEEDLKNPITHNLQAFLYLIEGIEYSDQGDSEKAQESFEKAMNEDPELTMVESLMDEIQVADMTIDKAEAYSPPAAESSASEVLTEAAAENKEDLTTSGSPEKEDPVDPNVYDQVVDQDNDGYADSEDCNDNNPGIYPGADDSNCDGVDNDCSGIPDDGYVSMPTECGIGACYADGSTSCVNGEVYNSCVKGTPSADTNCNGIDDDCDGVADESYDSQNTECGTGACYAEGSTSCVNGEVYNSCVEGTPSADSNCNGIDDDCDGVADESYDSQDTECGTGACYAEGSTSCVNGEVYNSCVEGTPSADSNCNGIDDDCDGVADESYDSQDTECGTGACYAEGSTSCVNGEVYNSCVEGTPSADSNCNGIDDDCDGVADESYDSQDTECGAGVCYAEGSTSCVNGIEQDSCVPLPPGPEICGDAKDNNCNEAVDEGCSSLIPPLVSIESINKAHENIFNDPVLSDSVDNGDFRPGTFLDYNNENQPLTNAFGYAWESEGAVYSVNGTEYNNLDLQTVGQISDQTLGLQTIGVDPDSMFPVVMLPDTVQSQINSDPFLAYAVQVEEDILNKEVLTLVIHPPYHNNPDPDFSNDIGKVMQDAMQQTQQAEFIRARDAFLLQKADAQSGRVLRDREGNFVRTQQYILRPSDTSVSLINITMRDNDSQTELSSIDLITNFNLPIPPDYDIGLLPWGDILKTQGPVGFGDQRYINFYNSEFYPDVLGLDSMTVVFRQNNQGYLSESRNFWPRDNEQQFFLSGKTEGLLNLIYYLQDRGRLGLF